MESPSLENEREREIEREEEKRIYRASKERVMESGCA